MWLSTLKRRIDEFNRAAVNHALEPIGVTVSRNIKAGHSLIDFAFHQLDDAYDRALMGVSFSAAAWEKFEPTTQEMAEELFSADQRSAFGNIIKNRLHAHFDAGLMDGQAFKRAESELSDRAWRYLKRYTQRDLHKALDGVVSNMQASLRAQNPAQAEPLQRVLEARRMFDLIVAAAGGVTAMGRFTPRDILCAALQREPEEYLRGRALMQDRVRSGNWGNAVLRAGPYNDDARLAELVEELAARLTAWDIVRLP